MSHRLRVLVSMLFVAAALVLASAAEAALTYSLSTPLKKDACTNDRDSDCLDQFEETNLAWALSPWYFYDEDESCSGWTNRFGLPSSHFARRDYFQVRPQGSGVRDWSATDGKAKWVAVTYFLNFPHDCAVIFGQAGHQGDSENVRFHLYSYDLRTWYLSHAYYAHHGRFDHVSGSFLQSNAQALGTVWASIAADQNSHGSWPGREVSSSHCAGSMDDFCNSFCDCFINTWRSDFQNGYMEFPSANRNVGGPPNETWDPSVVTVAGGHAYTTLDVGHGANREYWTPGPSGYQKFCGWECAEGWRRTSDNNCSLTIHDRSNCADGPLSQKVDPSFFSLDPPPPPASSSCQGSCGTYTGLCWCDAACVQAGDCCFDACSVCGQCGGGGGTEFPTAEAAGGGIDFDFGAAEEPATAMTPLRGASGAAGDGPSARERAARARRLAAEAAARLRAAAGDDPARRDDEQRRLARRAEDPVAALVPMLLDTPPGRQLATLRWAAGVPDRLRLAGLFDDLGRDAGLDRAGREEAAAERVLDLVALLQEGGAAAPAGAATTPVAEIVADAPEPNAYPPGGTR
jgi:hypothetical protein